MKARILIVDDEPEIREMLSRHFRFDGYDVETASDGNNALTILEQQRVDVVVSDIMMPGMNGIELLRQIRKEYPMVHTIMITGYIEQENILTCMRLGAVTCVFKPLNDLSELNDAIKWSIAAVNRWRNKLLQLKNMKPHGESD